MAAGNSIACEPQYFEAKGAQRIQINNFMGAVSVGVLAVLLSVAGKNFSPWTIGQLAISVPFFFTSSLAYSKICYRDAEERRLWDEFGWFAHAVAYLATVNAVVILLHYSGYEPVAWILVGTSLFLFVTYSIIDLILDRARLGEKLFKFGFYLLLIGIGSILPICCGW
jgi:hypothetical protein